ncbi:MAG: sensor histidine kinase [Bacteroidia bacterium]
MYILINAFRSINPDWAGPTFLKPYEIIAGIGAITLVTSIFWKINIALIYLENKPQNTWKPFLRYVLSFCFVLIIVAIVQFLHEDNRPIHAPKSVFLPFIASIANNTIILILIDLVITRSKKSQLELDKAYLEVANLVASQKHLKNHIHPHFLFNALGTLKILIPSNTDLAQQYVSRLSNFLRKSIQSADQDTAYIEEEISLFTDYMELQQVRFQNGLGYTINIPENIRKGSRLPVFTLQMLAENAINHNGFNQQNPLHISLNFLEEGRIEMKNNLIPKFEPNASTGTGLQNLTQRYKLLDMPLPRILNNQQAGFFAVRVSTKPDKSYSETL